MLQTSKVINYWVWYILSGIVIRADKEINMSVMEQMGFCLKLGQ